MSAAKDFLYQRKGPWPQPAPVHPLGEAPAVLHLPFKEQVEFGLFIGSRYVADIAFYWPIALKFALEHRGLQTVTNEEVGNIVEKSLFSKFLNPNLDPVDQ